MTAREGGSALNDHTLHQDRARLLAPVWRAAILFGLLAALAAPYAAIAQQRRAGTPDNFSTAQKLIQQGKLAEAKTSLLAELKRHPSSVDGYSLLGIVESEQGDYTNALAAFQQAVRLAPNSAKTHINLGNFYLTQRKTGLAEKQFRAALRTDPDNRDGNYDLGLLLMARQQPAQAISYFERVRPRDAATELNLIRAYLGAKRTAEALRLAEQLSAENEDDVKLHFSLGVLLASAGQYKPAELELEKADALAPGTFAILYSLGQAYMLDGNYSKAELELSQALAQRPDSAETLYLMGETYWRASRPLDALNSLVRAHALAPKNTDVILLMAQVSIAEGYYEDAIPLLQKGLAIAPHDVDLLSTLGESYLKADKVDKAIGPFQQIVALRPSARAYAYLGLSHASLGRFDLARQDFKNGLKLDPRDAFCLFNLGLIAQQQGDDDDATSTYEKVLGIDPNFAHALLQLATLRMQAGRFPEAEVLLKRYIRVAHNAAPGYYKLAMVERALRKPDAEKSDLAIFQKLSSSAAPKTFAYEDLFDYLDNRSKLSATARAQQDLTDLQQQLERHPDQPEILYLLAQAYLRSGDIQNAQSTIARLDKLKADDYRTLTGVGVLLARYGLYNGAIEQFQAALQINPASDDVKFDLADAYFREGRYDDALNTLRQIPAAGQDDAYLALLADIYAHTGDTSRAETMYRAAIARSPDNDQSYLSLALVQLREGDVEGAKQTLLQGQARVPASGKILWGLGVVSIMNGKTLQAEKQLERSLDLLPEWPGSYSMLGVFYFQTGQIAKAKGVLERFSNSSARGVLNTGKIEKVLDEAPATTPVNVGPMPTQARENLLHLALALADRTL